MVTYSNKDVKIKVDGAEIYCSSAALNYAAAVEPRWDIESRHSSKNIAQKAPEGNFNFTYFLTGADPFSSFVNNISPFSVNLNGLHINSGYLSSYSIDVTPHGLLAVDVVVGFFEKVKGTFTPDFSLLPSDKEILNVNNATIVGGSIVKDEKLAGISYAYDTTFTPNYVIPSDDRPPRSVNVVNEPQRQKVSLSIYDLDYYLPETGVSENFKINLNDKNGNTKQSFNINGIIGSKNISISAGGGSEVIVTELDMGQAHFSHDSDSMPSITSISPTEGYVRSSVTVVGEKFINVEKVLLGEFPCQITDVFVPPDPANAYTLSFDVSPDIFSGYKAPVYLITQGEKVGSPTVYSVTSGLIF